MRRVNIYETLYIRNIKFIFNKRKCNQNQVLNFFEIKIIHF